MNAGKLVERLTLKRPTTTISDTGAQVTTLTDVGSYWCGVKYGRGFRSVVNEQVVYGKSIYFTMRYEIEVRNTDIILYRNEKYRVLAIEYRHKENSVEVTTELIDE